MDAEAYADQLEKLLPRGPLWRPEPGGVLANLLLAAADELARVDGRARDLLEEADPRTTSELLDDWERVAGLPDPCADPITDPDERRAVLVAKLVGIGGINQADYVAVAADLGFHVEIEELHPWAAGIGFAGGKLTNDAWAFVWYVHAGDDLSAAEQSKLECFLRPLAPAHTSVAFLYDLTVLRPDPVVVTVTLPPVTVA